MVVLTSLLMFYFPYVELKSNAVEKLNERQMLIARQAALGIENFFREQRRLLQHFALHPYSIHLDQEEAEAEAAQWEYEAGHEHIKAITIYNSKGVILHSYPNPELVVGENISYQSHVSKILSDHKSSISDVFISVQGYQCVAMSEPIYDGEEFIGVIAFLIDFKYIAKNFLDKIKINDKGYAWMISRDGTELYVPVPGHTGSNIMTTTEGFTELRDMAAAMMRGESGITTYTFDMIKDVKVEPVKKYAVYVPVNIENNLWSIAVSTPVEEINDELFAFYQKMMFVVGLLIIGVIMLSYMVIKDYSLARRNEELEKLVHVEMEKRIQQESVMMQQARFYSMNETLNAIAHQWRQPLNSIGLCIQDLEESFMCGHLDEEYLQQTVETSMKSLTALSTTIDDFRNFFAETKELTDTNVGGVLYSIYSIVRVQYDAKGISFRFTIDGDSPEHNYESERVVYKAKIYPDMLKQVVLNCLQNSREAVEQSMFRGLTAKGEIWLQLSKVGDTFRIVIRDNGGGIDGAIIDRIYDPYFSTKNASIGMGLGLYIAKNIMEEQMNGSIDISNTRGGVQVVITFRSF
ncbi:sensor histidine kinase [Deferribacteres bacterium DY0037]|nr:sensor histidine kinase [Denitrovibrio acetiphilus]